MAVCTFKSSPRPVLGFTLIEVLLALAILAIALTALLKITAQNIENTNRIKDKNIKHWVGMQAISLLQLHMIMEKPDGTQVTKLLGQSVYWRVKVNNTATKGIQQLTLSFSTKQAGPFGDELIAFRFMG